MQTANGKLSPREREVLALIGEGCPNRVVAERLVISVRTVEAHKSRMLLKLRLANSTELARYAYRVAAGVDA